MIYTSTKTYGHEIGLSVAFRQWKAKSHCSLIHGYALAIRLEFEATELDERNWVIDFGGLKDLKANFQRMFDHKLLVAEDDPQLDELCQLQGLGVADVIVVKATGCEAFAKLVYDETEIWLECNRHSPRVRIAKVEVSEHGANSAIYMKDKDGYK